MEFRVTGGFNRLAYPVSQSNAEPDDENVEPTPAQISERSQKIRDIALRDSVRRRDPQFSGPLGSALTLQGVAQEPKASRPFEQAEFYEPKAESPTFEPTRDELENLRGAVVKVAEDYLRDQPTAELDDLRSHLDDVFGEGFSETVELRRVDKFNGQSEIHFEDFDYSTLHASEQDAVKAAIEVAKSNFKFSESGRESDDQALKFSDTSFTYESGRYDLSFSPSEVAESSSLTDNQDFLNGISRR